MSTQMRLALLLFAINTVLVVALMWEIRPTHVMGNDARAAAEAH